MDTTTPRATSGEAEDTSLSTNPFANSASVVGISDDDTHQPDNVEAGVSVDEFDGDRGSKRQADSEASSGIAKKTKMESNGMETNRERTIEELKEKANAKIHKAIEARKQCEAELQDALQRLEVTEQSRDELRAEKIAHEQKDVVRNADRKAKAAREKDWRNKIISNIKLEMQQHVEEKLATKVKLIERRLANKHATSERNLNTKLNEKSEKLGAVTEELKSLKLEHKDAVRVLKAQVKEQAKHGAPKAQQALLECQVVLKDKQKELDTANAQIDALRKQLIHKDAEIRSERTQKDDFQDVYNKSCAEIKILSTKNAEWKQRCNLVMKDSAVDKATHALEIQSLRTTHLQEMREMDKKWQIQATNSAESQDRVVKSQRALFSVNNANASLTKEIGGYQKKLQALAAEKRVKDEECRRLLKRVEGLEATATQTIEEAVGGGSGPKGESGMTGRQQILSGDESLAAEVNEKSEPTTGSPGWSIPPPS